MTNGVEIPKLAAEAKPFPAYGRTVSDCRDKVYFQIHFGANTAEECMGGQQTLMR